MALTDWALTRCNHSFNQLDIQALHGWTKNPVLASGEVRTLAVGIQHDVATSGSHAKPMKGTRALDPGGLQDPRRAPRCLNTMSDSLALEAAETREVAQLT